jgi:hypothetical protein
MIIEYLIFAGLLYYLSGILTMASMAGLGWRFLSNNSG